MVAVHCTGGYCRIGTVQCTWGSNGNCIFKIPWWLCVYVQARPIILGQKAIREVYSYSAVGA